MASPPFNIAETVPGDSDIASLFPATERTYRDVTESWITTEHDTYGHHKIPVVTTAARDAITTWSVGSLCYNTTLSVFQIVTAVGPVVWTDCFTASVAAPTFPTGTAMLFQQTSAPTGWTKDVTHNNKALRLINGTVSSGGTLDFTSVFAASYGVDSHTLTTAEIPVHAHTQQGSFNSGGVSVGHTHTYSGTSSTESANHTHSGTTGSMNSNTSHHHSYNTNQNESPFANGGGQTVASDQTNSSSTGDTNIDHTHNFTSGTQSANHTHTYSGTSSGQSADHTHSTTISGSTANAGSGTGHTHTVQLGVKYVDIILCTKD